MSTSSPKHWYYSNSSTREGPVEEAVMRDLIAIGRIQRDTLVWSRGMENWQRAGDTALQAFFLAPPPIMSSQSRETQTFRAPVAPPAPPPTSFSSPPVPADAEELLRRGGRDVEGASQPVRPAPSTGFYANYCSSEGRIDRVTWLVRWVVILLGFGLINAISVELGGDLGALIAGLFGLIGFGFYLVSAVKRLHDMDKSGWWVLFGLVPLVNLLFILVLLFGKGTSGENRYGPEP